MRAVRSGHRDLVLRSERVRCYAERMPRWLAILAAVPLALLLIVAASTVDDWPSVAFAKVTDGGLWTGLALFVGIAIVLALRPRADAQSRDSAKVK
ncbi:hypothetical protein GCM10007887_12520 [Methylobacterium haplocladii]|uniref:Uncharacterized protein n=2 Tax=Methylobacterium haplocladii TaxID=1176176 RepID=A0A512IKA3_9HYPH|nr:hypothetical protein MHA02_05410 [Methylobacterium haplocladii]GJD83600.1 hypothetical protein HPGCJGGD_1469 [Methylobacterium haplocladii]GLS58588.1 hypothetical protein GCM10007887_12520 [Methylobacterium haplocladii]